MLEFISRRANALCAEPRAISKRIILAVRYEKWHDEIRNESPEFALSSTSLRVWRLWAKTATDPWATFFIIDGIGNKVGRSVVGTNHVVERPNDNRITSHGGGDIRLYLFILC